MAYNTLVNQINQAIASNKVLDVSHITDDGHGTKKIIIPKRIIEDLPIASDNYESYLRAIKILGPNYDSYAQKYALYTKPFRELPISPIIPSQPSIMIPPQPSIIPSRPSIIIPPQPSIIPSRPSIIIPPQPSIIPSQPSLMVPTLSRLHYCPNIK